MACIAMKPVVDRLEAQTQGRLVVLRVDVQTAYGRTLAARYGFQYTPTFIFFDAQGVERWRRVGSLDPQQVLNALEVP